MTVLSATAPEVSDLLVELQQRGVQLRADGDRLRFRAPRGTLTAGLKQRLLAHKEAVLRHLDTESEPMEGSEMALPTFLQRLDERFEPFPLTDLQQAYWLGHQKLFELGNVSAHVYAEYDLQGVDIARLERAWNRLVQRHEMLRAVVCEEGRQRIRRQVPPYTIPIRDLSDLSQEECHRSMLTVREEMCKYGPQPDRWPLFAMRGFRQAEDHYRLHWSISLLICDDWSFHLLAVEWFRLYMEPHAELPSRDLSFRDYVLALRDFEDSPAYRRSLDYWRGRLARLPPAPELPLACDPGTIEVPWFTRRRRRLSPEEWRRFKSLAQQAGVTPSAAVCTVFVEVLAAFAKDRRFTLSTLFFNRLPIHPEIESVVGNTSSTLLLEVDCTGAMPFAARAQRLQQQLWRDLKHSQVSGVRVLRELGQSQHAAVRSMPVVFASNLNAGFSDDDVAPRAFTSVYNHMQTSHVWLDHQVFELPGGVFHYNWDAVEELFPEGLVERMFEAYSRLLERLTDTAAWQRPVGDLRSEEERRRDTAVNATAWSSGAADRCLHELVFERARRDPRALAVVAGNRRLDYTELVGRAVALGAVLRERGVRVGELVAVCVEPGWRQPVAVLAVHCAGAAYLPIDPGLPERRFRHLLEHGQARFALTSPAHEGVQPWPDGVERVRVPEDAGDLGGRIPQPPTVQSPTDLAYVIYTSGSTGSPKGVMIDHRGAVNTIADINHRFAVGPADRVLALSALNFDLSVYDIFGTLAAGGAVVYPNPDRYREPAHWLACMVEHDISLWNSVPALLEMLVDHLEGRGQRLPRTLRLALLSGDWIPVNLPVRVQALASDDTRVISLGGATEASIWSIAYPIERIDPSWVSVPYGQPMANQTFHVLDDSLAPRPTWVPGGLYIGGTGVALGYWRDAAKTETSFVEQPASGERLYRTGDLGRYLPSGDIEFLGREDFQVKVQGYRIELGEIESTLDQHPEVQRSVVAARGEHQGAKRLVAYTVAAGDRPPSAEALRAFLERRLPAYMVPGAYVALDSVPLSANGKVDRRALPAPGVAGDTAARDAVAPRNELEASLVQLWQELLEQGGIGVEDNFFDLGGHSLVAVRLLARVRRDFSVELALSALVEGPTVAQMASVIAQRQGGEEATTSCLVALTAGRQSGHRRPFFCVHPSGGNVLCYVELARRLGPEQPFYGLQAPGLIGEAARSETVTTLAERYLEEVKVVQPSGPYRLGGWSMGGVVAYEMARRLRADGEDVSTLAIIDTVAPGGNADQGKAPDDASLAAWFARDLGGLLGQDTQAAPDADDLRPLDPAVRLERIVAWAHGAGALGPDVGEVEVERLWRIFRTNFRAMLDHSPAPWDGPLMVLQAREGLAAAAGGDLGWERLAPQADVHAIEGDHYSIMAWPAVAVVAAALADALGAEPPTSPGGT